MKEVRSICDRVEVSVRRALLPGHSDVHCESTGGEVTLRGHVTSHSDRLFCLIVARTVPGVGSVKNLIEVRGDAVT
jgi:osmotically-inducible protein OsmY